ncbi:hypothetical protein JW960_03080 [candidate division KSB1 bacterium]|nr:hypothetical protein [candidate division KSB1 bacterium]
MPNIQPLRVLREKSTLKKLSETDEPVFITKNGNPFLVVMTPGKFDEIVQERDHYKQALEREKEIYNLSMKVDRSRKNISNSETMSEAEFENWIETVL